MRVLALTYWNNSNALFDFAERQSFIFRVQKINTKKFNIIISARYEITINNLTTFSSVSLTKIRTFGRF